MSTLYEFNRLPFPIRDLIIEVFGSYHNQKVMKDFERTDISKMLAKVYLFELKKRKRETKILNK
jgi:very-short-patch-repair endonuclease